MGETFLTKAGLSKLKADFKSLLKLFCLSQGLSIERGNDTLTQEILLTNHFNDSLRNPAWLLGPLEFDI